MKSIDEALLKENNEEMSIFLDYYKQYGEPLVREYSQDLDDKVTAIMTYLNRVRELDLDLDVPSLQRICLDLSTCIYYTNARLEQVNLLSDMAKLKYKDAYNAAYLAKQGNYDAGKKYTVEQLKAHADTAALEENLLNFIYAHAADTLKAKIDSANEVLKSCSKSLSAAIQEMSTYQYSNKFQS